MDHVPAGRLPIPAHRLSSDGRYTTADLILNPPAEDTHSLTHTSRDPGPTRLCTSSLFFLRCSLDHVLMFADYIVCFFFVVIVPYIRNGSSYMITNL